MSEPTQAVARTPEGASREPTTLAGLLDDQRRRWRTGEETPVEAYLDRHPDLIARPEEALDLIYQEIVLREEAGQSPRLEEYQRRFPRWAEQLADQFEVHRAIASSEQATPRMGDWPPSGRGPDAEPAGKVVAGCEILEGLGRGGMGAVYRAWEPGLNRVVALKMILAGAYASPAATARFRAEAEAVARLQHPNIVQVFRLGEHDGLPCLVLEYVPGGTLARALDGTPMPPRRAAETAEVLARAMQHAHGQGVVHRDLKPGNVLLAADGTPKVADFGLAKLLEGGGEALTPTGDVVGTPSYMAPEQAGGPARVGPAADVYALGAILYETLTGRPPFRAETAQETLRQVVCEEPVPPGRLRPRLSRDLETICLKCLEKAPAKRYATAEALADDLRRYLDGRPIRARRVGPVGRLARWAGRRPAVAGLTAAVVLLAAAGVVGLVLSSRNERRLRLQAEEKRVEAEAVLAFLKEDVLSATRPESLEGALGKDVTVRKAIDAAEPRIAGAFRYQPAVEADIRDTLGTTYYHLGEAPLAIRQFERALDLRQTDLGPDHPDTLVSRNNLAMAYLADGRTAEAIALHEANLKIRESKLGPDHPDTFTSRNGLAAAYRAAGRRDEGLSLYEANLRRREAKLGPDHPSTLSSRNNLAEAYFDAGRRDEAIALHEGTLKMRESKLGPDHPSTLSSRNNLAEAYFDAGRRDEAIALHKANLKIKESKLGPDHPSTLTSRHNLADSYRDAGRMDEAIALHEATLKLKEAKLGPDHPLTLFGRNSLAQAYRAAGRCNEAIALHEVTLKLRESKLGPDHPDTLISRSNLAAAYRDAGRTDAAIALLEPALKRMETKLGADNPNTLTSRSNLADSYRDAGRTDAAIALHEATLKLKEAKLGPDHPLTLLGRHSLARAYRAAGQSDRAVALLEQVLPDFRAKVGPVHPYTLSTEQVLADAYEALGRWADAESLRRELLARRRTKANSLQLAGDLARLGSDLLHQAKWTEAETILRECLAIREKEIPDDWSRSDTMSLLGGALLGQARYAEAEPLIVQGYEGMKAREAQIPAQGQPRLPEAAACVVHVYEGWGRPEQAAEWRRKLFLADLPADVFAWP